MHRTENVRYNTFQDSHLIGRHNKRGQQVTLPLRTRNNEITKQKYIQSETSTLPRLYENVQTRGYKRHGNTIHSIHSMHSLANATKYGMGVVVPQRARETKVYFENKTV